MSLINDALKRAAADKVRDVAASASGPTMQPVESDPPRTSRIMPVAMLLLAVGVLGIAAALWLRDAGPNTRIAQDPTYGAKSSSAASDETPARTDLAAISRLPKESSLEAAAAHQSSAVQPPVAIIQPKPAATSPSPSQENLATSNPTTPASTSPAPAPTAAAINVPNLESRPPKLQAIYYRMKGPTAVINGKTVSAGQSVDGFKIMSIQRSSVEVQQNGRYKTLTLGQD